MICVTMEGRLGNQFFKYAYARELMFRRGENDELVIDFAPVLTHHHANNDGFEDSLCHFQTVSYTTSNRKLVFAKGSIIQILVYAMYSLSRRISLLRNIGWTKILDRVGVVVRHNCYEPFDNICDTKILFLMGQCQLPLDFQDIKEQLRKEFTPIEPPLDSNAELYRVINSTNSVCVSVRRGDYLSDRYKKDFYVCDEQYFAKAMREIRKHVENPVLIFFSDDIEWVKKNIEVEGKAYYESGNDPVWEKLRLMYSCKHFILSNSTFSWLSQYLCANTQKVVVSPDRFFNNKNWSSVLLDDESFIKIEC